MMRTVIKDKKKIEETIVELDRYKKDALVKTWEKVDGDFGAIFNELLPGSWAKLVPQEGKEVSEGLEVKVQLGKVWKQSLTELSGGQRYDLLPWSSAFLRMLTCYLKVTYCTLAHHGSTTVQASAHVHSR